MNRIKFALVAVVLSTIAAQNAFAENCSRYSDPTAIGHCLVRNADRSRDQINSYNDPPPYRSQRYPTRQDRSCTAQGVLGFGYNVPMEKAWCR